MKTFDALYTELRSKVAMNDTNSGTVAAVEDGVNAVGRRMTGQAAQAWVSASGDNSAEAAEAIALLLYEIQVLMLARGIALADVYEHL